MPSWPTGGFKANPNMGPVQVFAWPESSPAEGLLSLRSCCRAARFPGTRSQMRLSTETTVSPPSQTSSSPGEETRARGQTKEREVPRVLKEAEILTRPVQRLKTAGKSLLPLTCPRKKQWRMSLLSVPLPSSAPKCTTV